MLDKLANISWLVIFVVGAVGALLAYIGNLRQERWLRHTGAVLFTAGLLAASLHFLIDTDEEKMDRQTRKLIANINSAAADQLKNAPSNEAAPVASWANAESMLDKATELDIGRYGGTIIGGHDIIKRAVDGVRLVGLASLEPGGPQPVRVDTYEPTPTHSAKMIAVLINVVSVQDATQARPMYSSWEFDWEQRADKSYYLQAIKLNKLNGEDVAP